MGLTTLNKNTHSRLESVADNVEGPSRQAYCQTPECVLMPLKSSQATKKAGMRAELDQKALGVVGKSEREKCPR